MARLPSARIGFLALAVVPYALALLGYGFGTPLQSNPNFAKDVAPIFKAHCYSCHKGPQAAAGLDLSSASGIAKGGVSGKPFVPGKPDASLLIKRVRGLGGMAQMPMGFAPLTEAQISSIRGWIAAGASLTDAESKHWAYIPPKRPVIPSTKNVTWVRNPIDAFILSRLEKSAIKPSPEATRETLARRLYLDLIGMPPSIAELDAFLADRSPTAYDRLISKLLASPHFGERQARGWLDLARYADSNGYEADAGRTAWKYRDWVIDAFNRNMPYDQFTIEQLAGDLLPNPTIEQLVATGFHRNTMLNLEGGVDPKEARYEMINDRVATTSQVWLGQTMQCARCHDHKYDPISQKDYFRMYAIFANTTYEARGDAKVGQEKYYEPSIEAPTSAQAHERARRERELQSLQASLKSATTDYENEKTAFFDQLRSRQIWEVPTIVGDGLRSLPKGVLQASEANPANVVYRLKFRAPAGTCALRIDALPDASLVEGGPGRSSSGNFILSRMTLLQDGSPVQLAEPAASYVQGGYNLAGLFDADGNTGWAISPQYNVSHWLIVRLAKPLTNPSDLVLELGHESPSWPKHTLLKFSARFTREPDQSLQLIPDSVYQLLSESPSPKREQALDDFFIGISRTKASIRERIAKAEAELAELKRQIPLAMVMQERRGTGQLTTPFHPRGEFLQIGPLVTAGIPEAFGQANANRIDRLALAKWIVDKRNPLTARVEVNRIWEQYFGHGIVETSENWGAPGTPPTHPALLDWLACELMDSGWNLKRIHRLIVSSATYRQSSNVSKSLLERDPSNKLYARASRSRMEAEMIRDNALAIAGLLSPKIGGPSVFPHQPDGVWNNPYSGERWNTSKGPELYRRGLYTFWKRTATYPTFINFDATSRESCTIRRSRTNTPLQALNLLNDPAFIDAARAFAKKSEDLADPTLRIRRMFRTCTARNPSKSETDRLQALLKNLRLKYAQKPDEAKALANDADSASWIMLANVLLNLDETITKE